MRMLMVIAGLLVIVVAGLLMTAAFRWNARTSAEIAKLDHLIAATKVVTFESAQLHGLPARRCTGGVRSRMWISSSGMSTGLPAP